MRPISRIDSFCDFMNDLMQEAGIVNLMQILIKIREMIGFDLFFPEDNSMEEYACEVADETPSEGYWSEKDGIDLTRFWRTIAIIWKKVPDWRFGQLITNFVPINEEITNDIILEILKQEFKVEAPLYIIETCRALPCETEIFEVKGVPAQTSDFGHSESEGDGNYGCAYHKFIPYKEPKKEALEEYHINEEEYKQICEALESKLYVEHCGWCS